MSLFKPIVRFGIVVLSLGALAACDPPKWREVNSAPNVASDTGPGAAPTQPVGAPAWAAQVVGKPLRKVFPSDGQCIGNTEAVDKVAGVAGVKVRGWAWDSNARQPMQRVVIVDDNAIIVGAGETGLERLDVPAALPNVTSKTTGWLAATAVAKGPLDAFGVLRDGSRVCSLGHIKF
jgi:hypothetical protein